MVHLLISPLLGNTSQNSKIAPVIIQITAVSGVVLKEMNFCMNLQNDSSKKKKGVDSACTTNVEIISISFSYTS